MVTELETMMLCLQRRYNILREISRLTVELAEAVERRDNVSASLLLGMRGEEMERHAACEEELIQITEQNSELRKQLHDLAFGSIEDISVKPELFQDEKEAWMRQKIHDIRLHTQSLLEETKKKDSMIARRVRNR